MKRLAISLSFLMSATLMSQNIPKLESQKKIYDENGSKVMEKINNKSAKSDNTSNELEQMISSAVVLLNEYAKGEPKSKQMVEYLLKNLDKIKSASFEQLQKDWHDAGILTEDIVGLDLIDEDNEKFLDPMHALVHVVMTKVAIKDGNLQAAKEELAEGIEQYESSLKNLKK